MINSNLTLSDYKKIRTPFVFFDETGSVNDKNNRYFGLGMIKLMQPHFLDTRIRFIRQKYKFYDEMKWNKISKKNLNVILEILDEVFITPGVNFSSIIINKDIIDFEKEFNHDPYKAYQDFSERLLCKNIKYNEVLIVLADYISTPNHIHYEVDLKHSINSKFNRLSVGGIHRIDSRSVNLIQVVDLLIGSVIYEYKISSKLVNGDKFKLKVSKYILNRLNIKSFIGGTESKNFRVSEQV